jgi:hypothetical protein
VTEFLPLLLEIAEMLWWWSMWVALGVALVFAAPYVIAAIIIATSSRRY